MNMERGDALRLAVFLVVPLQTLNASCGDAPRGGGASGGSLRSSRQAVACHPFTR